jgi:hypothetical protein
VLGHRANEFAAEDIYVPVRNGGVSGSAGVSGPPKRMGDNIPGQPTTCHPPSHVRSIIATTPRRGAIYANVGGGSDGESGRLLFSLIVDRDVLRS